MNKKLLYDLIDSFVGDVQLIYKDKEIFIDPLVRNQEIYLGYEDLEKQYTNVDDLMSDKIFDGKSLSDICGDLEVI